MDVAVSEAKAQLTDLVRRAEAGEEVVLTRHGQPTVRLVPVRRPQSTPEERAAVIEAVWAMARERKAVAAAAGVVLVDEPSERASDFLYGEDGLPA